MNNKITINDVCEADLEFIKKKIQGLIEEYCEKGNDESWPFIIRIDIRKIEEKKDTNVVDQAKDFLEQAKKYQSWQLFGYPVDKKITPEISWGQISGPTSWGQISGSTGWIDSSNKFQLNSNDLTINGSFMLEIPKYQLISQDVKNFPNK